MSVKLTGTRIAIIGNYLPRQCGIATFTTDLCESLNAKYPQVNCFALPVNDRPEGYSYPPRVRFELGQNDLSSYRAAADFLNINNVDLVCVQHEYGIFGGPAGSHILALLRELRMPIVTTLHTVLTDPDANQRTVLTELAQLSDRLVVMSYTALKFLREIYRIPEDQVDVIHHGVPDIPFVDPNFYKDQFGLQGKTVLLTFGLLSPNKGIEYVIDALPEILKKYPNVVYVILGATHPHVRQNDGESYRLSLERRARERGIDEHVAFYNRFVSAQELAEFIGAADIYITPYLNQEQIVSGTLAYTLGAGKAVISTPYWYAEELLREDRGVVVPFRDSNAVARRVIEFLSDEPSRHAMRKRAFLLGREMVWSNVATLYMNCFERVREQRMLHPRPVFAATMLRERRGELPSLKLDHLRRLTDDTGILQHAVYTVPNYNEGYTTDDNARALLLAVLLELGGERVPEASRYMAFLWHAFNPDEKRFRNLLSYERRWREERGSEDCHGRAFWSLGTVLGRSKEDGLRGLSGRLFEASLEPLVHFTSPRAWAFAVIGLQEYLNHFPGDRAAREAREQLARKLLALHRAHATKDWYWFEDTVAYDNASLPYGLLAAGAGMSEPEMIERGLGSLRWLATVETVDDHFAPVGSNGLFSRGCERARFDQQPVEAHSMVAACVEAWRITQDRCWLEQAQRAFEWFLGRNDIGCALYDPSTGGCRDGLHPDRVNANQGAEATLSFLLSLVLIEQAYHVFRS